MNQRYQELYAAHRWQVPADFNIAAACCRRWADGSGRIALHLEDEAGVKRSFSFDHIQTQANCLSNVLRDRGVAPGERVALMLPQTLEAVVAHMAIYQMGAVVVPLSILFGADAIGFRMHDSGAVAAIVTTQARRVIDEIAGQCPALGTVIEVAAAEPGSADVTEWTRALAAASDLFVPVPGNAADPAVLIYTSGTTGAPKGALVPHRALLGNLSGFVLSQGGFPIDDDVFWSPADWAWTGGLMDALLPTLYFGRPIVGAAGRFDPLCAFRIIEEYGVTNTFLFPTALKMMMKAVPEPRDRYRLKLRAIMSAGEAVGTATFEWCRNALGITVNEMFGQTEVNYVVGNAHHCWPARPGSIGRPYPGHRVAILDAEGAPCAASQPGEIAVHRRDMHGDPDPVFFLGYWNNPVATQAKFAGADGDWCLTGDLAYADQDGYFWYQGRADDMFKAAGYRIGPGEIENCLIQHAAVANAAVVPTPDPERGNLIKAFVVLTPGYSAGPALIAELQDFVRGKLAPYEYPKEIEFIAELPMTTTGKVQRRVLRLMEAEKKAAPGGA